MSSILTAPPLQGHPNDAAPHNAIETQSGFTALLKAHRPDDYRRLRRSAGRLSLENLAWEAFGMPIAAVLSASPADLTFDWRRSTATAIAGHARALRNGWQQSDPPHFADGE